MKKPEPVVVPDLFAALEQADARMATARHRFSLAALSCLRNAFDSAEQVRRALREVDDARASLQLALRAARGAGLVAELESAETAEGGEFEGLEEEGEISER